MNIIENGSVHTPQPSSRNSSIDDSQFANRITLKIRKQLEQLICSFPPQNIMCLLLFLLFLNFVDCVI